MLDKILVTLLGLTLIVCINVYFFGARSRRRRGSLGRKPRGP
jgi:hypothetical protein